MKEVSESPRPRCTKLQALQRVEELLRIRLDGAEFWDVREYVREKEQDPTSCWFLTDNDPPLSDGSIRRYQLKADKLMLASHERSRRVLFRRHLAQRRSIFAKALSAGDHRTALAALRDEAEMLGLYPAARNQHTFPQLPQVTQADADAGRRRVEEYRRDRLTGTA